MDAISRFVGDLWILFLEMRGLEIIVGIFFFFLGLWYVRRQIAIQAQRSREGVETEARLQEAAAALQGGISDFPLSPLGHMKHAEGISDGESGKAPVGTPKRSDSFAKESGPAIFQETEHSAKEWLSGTDTKAGEGKDSPSSDTSSDSSKDVTEIVKHAREDQPHLTGDELVERIVPPSKGELLSSKREAGAEIAHAEEEGPPPPLSSYEEAAEAFADEKGVTVDREFGILFAKRPARGDDLRAIRGIGPKIESQLHAAGVFRYAQIANWNPHNAAAFEKKLKFPGRIEREGWISQAGKLASQSAGSAGSSGAEPGAEPSGAEPAAPGGKGAGGAGTQESPADVEIAPLPAIDLPLPAKSAYAKAKASYKTEPVEVDRKLGIVFPHRPGIVDDLTEIGGVGPEISAKLNGDGIYRFRQIAQWNGYNVAAFNQRLRFKGRIERDEWIPQAKKLERRSSREVEKFGRLIKKRFAGESVSVKPGIGIVYLDPPETRDDLSAIAGEATAKKLQKIGIYRYKQIELWDGRNASAVDQELGLEAGTSAGWKNRAKALAEQAESEGEKSAAEHYRVLASEAFGDEDVIVDPKLGVLFKKRPKNVDDLTRIKGIAKVLSGRLNEFGVYRFQQIANWNEFTIKAFAKRLKSFQDRMYRDRWVEQAAEFHREGKSEKN